MATKKKPAKKKAVRKKAASKKKSSKKKTSKKKQVVKSNLGGRPTKFKPEYIAEAEKLCAKLYATDMQLAAFFEVNVDSIYEWKKVHPEFSDAIKRGKAVADETIEQSLFHRAAGYSHEDTHITTYYGQVIKTPVMKYYPPEPVACIFWLTNRKRGDWKRNIDNHDSGEDVPALNISYEVRKPASEIKVTRGS